MYNNAYSILRSCIAASHHVTPGQVMAYHTTSPHIREIHEQIMYIYIYIYTYIYIYIHITHDLTWLFTISQCCVDVYNQYKVGMIRVCLRHRLCENPKTYPHPWLQIKECVQIPGEQEKPGGRNRGLGINLRPKTARIMSRGPARRPSGGPPGASWTRP